MTNPKHFIFAGTVIIHDNGTFSIHQLPSIIFDALPGTVHVSPSGETFWKEVGGIPFFRCSCLDPASCQESLAVLAQKQVQEQKGGQE